MTCQPPCRCAPPATRRSGHLPGWHLWYRADPARPVHLGPLARCHAVELRARGTCPGSPGYLVCSHPDDLPILPWRLSGLAGPPPASATVTMTGHGGAHAEARLRGIVGRLLAARRGERNRLLFWASLRAGELVVDGDLDARTAAPALTDAAAQIGLAGEDGPRAVAATIRSGFHRAGAAYEPRDHRKVRETRPAGNPGRAGFTTRVHPASNMTVRALRHRRAERPRWTETDSI